MAMRLTSLFAVALTLGGCATAIDYPALPAGSFSGSLIVIWVGEGGGSGDGRFVNVPDPDNPLTFRRANSNTPGATIRPGLMYTDGGSIPKIAQVFNGLSPWGYAPAYMVHDWLFTARHCLADGQANAAQAALANVTFEDSAIVLGEAIQALVAARQVARRDVAAGLISNAVATGVARGLWEAKGVCAREQVSAEHKATAEAAIPGSAGVAAARRAPPSGSGVALVITRVRF